MIPSLAAGLFLTALGKKIHLKNLEVIVWLVLIVALDVNSTNSAIYVLLALLVVSPFVINIKRYAQMLFRASIIVGSVCAIYLNLGG